MVLPPEDGDGLYRVVHHGGSLLKPIASYLGEPNWRWEGYTDADSHEVRRVWFVPMNKHAIVSVESLNCKFEKQSYNGDITDRSEVGSQILSNGRRSAHGWLKEFNLGEHHMGLRTLDNKEKGRWGAVVKPGIYSWQVSYRAGRISVRDDRWTKPIEIEAGRGYFITCGYTRESPNYTHILSPGFKATTRFQAHTNVEVLEEDFENCRYERRRFVCDQKTDDN